MSLTLSESGVEAKTGVHFTNNEPYVELDNRETSLAETVTEIEKVLTDPTLINDPHFQDFVTYIKSMYPREGEGDQQRDLKWLWPGISGYELGEETEPSINLLGYTLSRNDTMDFIDYVLTNTSLEENDPRVAFLDRLRAGVLDSSEPSQEVGANQAEIRIPAIDNLFETDARLTSEEAKRAYEQLLPRVQAICQHESVEGDAYKPFRIASYSDKIPYREIRDMQIGIRLCIQKWQASAVEGETQTHDVIGLIIELDDLMLGSSIDLTEYNIYYEPKIAPNDGERRNSPKVLESLVAAVNLFDGQGAIQP